MSTEYPILDDRPINKWKVAELKEELKRRNLMTRGLKDDLVKRLDEAIRNERAAIEAEEGEGFDSGNEPAGDFGDAKVESSSVQMANEALEHDSNEVNKVDEVLTGMNIDDGPTKIDQGKALEQEATVNTDPITMVGESAVVEAPSATINVQDEVILLNITSNEGALGNNKVGKDDEGSDSSKKHAVFLDELGTSEASVLSIGEPVDSQVASSMVTLEEKNSKIQKNEVEGTDLPPEKAVENEEFKPENKSLKSHMDADCNEPYSGDQVYEVSPNLGFQVKSKSFSTDILTVNEKKELKNNLNADNVQLEPEIVRLEMLQPSPIREPPGDGIFHPLGDLMPPGNQSLHGETDDDQSKNLEINKKNDNVEKFPLDVSVVKHNLESEAMRKVGCDNELDQISFEKDTSAVSGLSPEKVQPSAEETFSSAASGEERKPQDESDDFSKTPDVADGELLEKVNIDQSCADDSMEEDTSETRHVESDYNSVKVGEKTESDKEPGIREGGRVDVVQHLIPSEKLESSNEQKDSLAALSEKRKVQDATEAGNEEPPKRQRRWNSESQKVPESQRPDASLSMRPKASLQTASTRLNLTGAISTLDDEALKERAVPPSQKTPTTSLRIDHFLRPFTLKAVQELLAKSGKVCSFWMDHIKTHCYVTYSSVEEAIETRNAVYNIQWPPNGGRLLVADFVDPEEVKLRMEAPTQSAAPSVNTSTSAVKPPAQPAPPTHQQGPRNHEPQHPLLRQPLARDSSTMREQLTRAPSPVAEKIDPPIITLDDLFRKTRTTPRIYYLPLTDEQVAAKVARQKRDMQ